MKQTTKNLYATRLHIQVQARRLSNKQKRTHAHGQESKVASVHIYVTNYAILKTSADGCLTCDLLRIAPLQTLGCRDRGTGIEGRPGEPRGSPGEPGGAQGEPRGGPGEPRGAQGDPGEPGGAQGGPGRPRRDQFKV